MRFQESACKATQSFILVLTGLVMSGLLVMTSICLGAGDRWSKKADMQTPRLWHSSCVVDGKIYAIGGHDNADNIALSTVEKYSPKANQWTYVTDMPSVRWGHSANVVDGKIYIIGGTRVGRAPILPVLEYDPAKDKWTKKGNTPVGFKTHCSAAVNGRIYVFGGSNNDDSTDSKVLEYDPKTDTWTKKADMPTARFLAAAGVVNAKVYIIGGGEEWNEQWDWPVFSTVEEYEPATDTWTEKTGMPTARDGLSVSVLNGKLYAIGGVPDPVGADKREGYTSIVEEYDPGTDKWKRVADMTVTRRYLSTTTFNGRIYATGGYSREGYLSTVEVYTPEDWHAVFPRGKLPTKWGGKKTGK